MKCKNCPYFRIRQRPIKGFDLGMAECKKHDLVVDFRSMTKVNMLECVEDEKKGERK
jgi:hypothetical protein